MDREKVLDTLLETKVIAVIRMSDVLRLSQVVAAIQEGGVKAIEITMTTPGALDVIEAMAKMKPDDVLVGAGTVLDGDAAAAVIRAGADFVVSPVTHPEMIRVCVKHQKLVAPGAFSPTEILRAWDMGADIVKIFPATSLGPKYFKDIHGPLPEIRLMPTGGVSLENAADFIKHGACCVGIGTALLDKKAIAEGNWALLTEKARALIESLSDQTSS